MNYVFKNEITKKIRNDEMAQNWVDKNEEKDQAVFPPVFCIKYIDILS
jgi:hypothetical protein